MLVGAIYLFAGSTSPEGFLICNGAAVSRSTYSELFDAIGVSFGVGDGSTTFNLPDLSGRVAMGTSSVFTLGSAGGEETHTLDTSELPVHTHTIPTHGHAHTIKATTPALTHSVTQPAFKYNKPNGTFGGLSTSVTAYSGTSSTAATRSANLTMSNHAAADCTMSGGISDCAAFNTENAGQGNAHNNMQPFMTMNYIIYTGV